MDDLYRDYILEHYRRPHNFGVLEDAERDLRGQQPAVRRPDHAAARRRRTASWSGSGSPAEAARSARLSASLLTDEIKGKPLADVAAFGPTTCWTCSASRSAPPGSSARCSAIDTLQPRARRGRRPAATVPPARRGGPTLMDRCTCTGRPDLPAPPSGAGRLTRPSSLTALARQAAARSIEPEHTTHRCPRPMPSSCARPAPRCPRSSPAETDALRQRGGAARRSTSARRPSGTQGHVPGAAHVSKSYVEQQIEAAAPDRDAPGRPLLRRRRPRRCSRPRRCAEMGYTDVASMKRRLPGLEDRGPRVDAAGAS